MGRLARFTNDQFIDAAMRIAAAEGPAAVTVAAVAREIGAPVGSVYHRFLSRDVLLAEVWLKIVASFQEAFLRLLENGRGLEAALHTPRWVRQHPAEARIILLYRREELVAGDWPADLKTKAQDIKRRLDDGIVAFAAAVLGGTGREEVERTVFALVDVPYGAVIRYIRQGRKPPREIDGYIRQTYTTIMGREE